MTQLTTQRIGKAEIDELRNSIGEFYSDNASSTSRSKLVGLSEDGLIAYTEEVGSAYQKKVKPAKGVKEQASWLVWNGMFY